MKAEGDAPGTQLYTATEQIKFVVGKSSITLNPDSIILQFSGSTSITLNAANIDAIAPLINLNKDKG